MSNKTILCIVKSSSKIKKALTERFKELRITKSDIVQDAEQRGHPIGLSTLSRYLNKGAYVKSGLSQEHILFLCVRYSIDIKLIINVKDYNKSEAIENLKKYFG